MFRPVVIETSPESGANVELLAISIAVAGLEAMARINAIVANAPSGTVTVGVNTSKTAGSLLSRLISTPPAGAALGLTKMGTDSVSPSANSNATGILIKRSVVAILNVRESYPEVAPLAVTVVKPGKLPVTEKVAVKAPSGTNTTDGETVAMFVLPVNISKLAPPEGAG